MSYLYNEGVIYAEYQIAATTSATSALPIVFDNDWGIGRVIVEAEGADIVFHFGGSTVVANSTPDSTTKKLVGKNFSITSGAIISANVDKPDQTGIANLPNTVYVSVITPTGSGTAKIKLIRI